MTPVTKSSPWKLPRDPRPRLGGIAPNAECDLCGVPVRRETGFPRIHYRDGGFEIVPVCRDCELGTD
jgi:hypothetical protein